MKISFIHMQSVVHLHVNKTNFHMKGFALGLALKQRQKATRKSPIWNGQCVLATVPLLFVFSLSEINSIPHCRLSETE